MFSLMCGFYEQLNRKNEIKILMLGLDQAGKTSLLERLKTLPLGLPPPGTRTLSVDESSGPPPSLPATLPTVGLNIAHLSPSRSTEWVVWDLGGGASLRGIWSRYVGEADALIWVADASLSPAAAARLAESRQALEDILRGAGGLEGVPLLVLASKVDVGGPGGLEAVEGSLGESARKDGRPVRCLGADARTGDGLVEGLHWLHQAARERGRPFER